ncbi:filamentous haemagglutinin family protein [Rhodomicrobium lacus]|uniref:filamentous haemagglutinin family protein n=1 Tax=Rhodomicrobium lacus TaxID=2498452 RepID=UPI000F8F062A|nr:filamentous haemagglutinin family protein [Rhodomicrobium lacus]
MSVSSVSPSALSCIRSRRVALFAGVSMLALMAGNPALARPLTGSTSATDAAAAATAAAAASSQAAATATQNSLLKATQAIQAMRAAQAAARAAASGGTVANGLVTGGLVPDSGLLAPGVAAPVTTWVNAKTPVQTTGSDGSVAVDITQTDSRAILNWQSFNVGSDTTLTFNQESSGTAVTLGKGDTSWIALNRVSNSIAPSQILGQIKADGTILVINQNGIIFGAGSQINVHSLIASTIEIGRSTDGSVQRTIAQRNADFLEYGLTGSANTSGNSTTTFSGTTDPAAAPSDATIKVEAGATITSDSKGMILLMAPTVNNAGWLSAADGQVSLVGVNGLNGSVYLAASDGSDSAQDPYVRGYLVSSAYGTVMNSGLIEAERGYISLGNSYATVTNSGILRATTSVSANGTIDLIGDKITLAPGSLIFVGADENGETIPQSEDSLSAFKTSQVRIGTYYSTIAMQSGAMIVAPSGDVTIGQEAGDTLNDAALSVLYGGSYVTKVGSIVIEDGATIDVAGLKNVPVSLSSYNLEILLKGNELADSGGYQTSALNGETVWIDARLSGVREDGVAWIGSPLISAASYYEAVGVTAAQLMTKGGNVVLGTNGGVTSSGLVPSVTVKSGAVIDISGGWVTYEAGFVKTSKLVTSSGALVDIGSASLSDTYVAVVDGSYTVTNDRWGTTDSYWTPLARNSTYTASYTEGRDAGTLTIKSAQVTYDGALYATAYAGSRQIAEGTVGTGTSSVYGDLRNVQAAASELPAGGLLFIQEIGEGSTSGLGAGGDIVVVAATDYAARNGTTVLSDQLLSGSGLSQVSLWTSGSITVDEKATVSLAAGGVFDAYSGRSITIAGTVTAAGGTILLETANVGAKGSVFNSADDALVPGSFDITVTGTLSVAGLWVNDWGTSDISGPAYLDGGTIAMVSAASVTDQKLYDLTGAVTSSTDVSGSILLADAKLIDLSGGGRVKTHGTLDLSGTGGNIALINQSAFYQTENVVWGVDVLHQYFGQLSGFRANYEYAAGYWAQTPINPTELTSTVQFNPDSIRAAGFAGGGTFTLWAPDVKFGSGSADDTALATALPLDFFQKGFSTYDITSYKTLLIENTFVDATGASLGGNNALLGTQTFTVKADETLTLSQALLPGILTSEQAAALRKLSTGGDINTILTASVPTDTWDQRAVNLKLDGMVELKVEAGGTIVAAPAATLTVAKLLNEGTIRLPGGSIAQSQTLPSVFSGYETIYAVKSLDDVFTVSNDGTIVETAASRIAGKTNAVVAMNGMVYLLGDLGEDDGVVLATGSVTDLSGVSVINPRGTNAAGVVDSSVRTGIVYDAGSIVLASASTSTTNFYRDSYMPSLKSTADTFRPGLELTIAAGASVALDGTSDTYREALTSTTSGSLGTGLATALTAREVWSDAGAISAPNGFTISSAANLSAKGGNSSAEGGILELADVVLTQSIADSRGELAANQIMSAGFTTLASLGTLGSQGDVSLELGKALFVASRPYDSGSTLTTPNTGNANAVVVSAGGHLSITAPYIGLISSMDVLTSTTTGTVADNKVTLNATKAFDITGAVLFDRSVASTELISGGDLRMTGVQDYKITYLGYTTDVGTALTSLLHVNGNLSITAAQVYPTTGTTATIKTGQADGTITFARSTSDLPDAPYSAGASLTVSAATIIQGGVIRVPLGSLTLAATGSLTLADGSYTEVSANGLIIPYGTTTDGVEWYFTPTGSSALKAAPEKVLTLRGTDITVSSGAVVNVSGGGDVTAYEFSAGTGGSRDVLSSTNEDAYTSTNGCTYAGCMQAYAIVPGLSDAAVAAYDPVYSQGYSELSSVSGVGSRVLLDIGYGLQWYTLLPAKYATLEGGVLVVRQTASTSLTLGSSYTRADGTLLTVGSYGNALSGSSQSATYLFAVQSQDVYEKYSSIALTSGNTYFTELADDAGTTVSALPTDAGQLVLNASNTLVIDAALKSAAAEGGRGAKVDIAGTKISIVSELPGTPTAGTLTITASSLSNLGAESLLIGATRTDNEDDTTTLSVSASSITVANDTAHAISAGEIVMASTGSITIADGSAIIATGEMADNRAGVYVLGENSTLGTGALIRVANGPERLTSRTNFTTSATLAVGAATLSGTSVMLDSSGTMSISNSLSLKNTTSVALGAGRIGLGITDASYTGVVVTPEMQAILTQNGGQLTLRSQSSIDFADGTYQFGKLKLDASILTGTQGGAVKVVADTVTLGNSGTAGYTCSGCAANAGTLAIEADEFLFSGGLMATTATTVDVDALLSYDTVVTVPAGTYFSDTQYFLQDTRIVLQAGIYVALYAGTGVITPTAAATGTEIAPGTEIKIAGAPYTLVPGSYVLAGDTTYATVYDSSVASNGKLAAGSTVSFSNSPDVALPTGTAVKTDYIYGQTTTDYFSGGVTLTAANGVYVTGQSAGFSAGSAALTLHTPYVGDRSSGSSAVPDLTLATTGALVIDNAAAAALDITSLGGIPGTSLTITGGSVAISGTTVHATGGLVQVTSASGITLAGGAVVEAPGYSGRYGDATDSTTASSGGGTVRLTATAGDITLGAGTLVSVAGDDGDAGRLELSAVAGAVTFGGTIDGRAGTDGEGGTFALETRGAIDLVTLNAMVSTYGFTGGFEVHTHSGDLDLAAGQTLKSGSVVLTADGGFVTISGTIDTSGVNGGNIELWGNKGVTLTSTARLDAHADGYESTDPRQASAGDITLGTDFITGTTSTSTDGAISGTSGTITIAAGAKIDLSAKNTSNRVIELESGLGYYYVEGDTGGTLRLRAPVYKDANGKQTVDVDVASASSVVGAESVVLEGFRRWDLLTVAKSGSYKGVTYSGANVTLNASTNADTWTTTCTSAGTCTLGATVASGLNFLSDRDWTGAHETVVSFVQDLDLSAAYSKLGGLAVLTDSSGSSIFSVSPGVDLVNSGNITLASNWNLGAGAVDTTSAFAAGLMKFDAALSALYVVSGQEDALLANYTSMIYRTGGKVGGGAPTVNLRASGSITSTYRISDGTFQFQDTSNSTYRALTSAAAGSGGVYVPVVYVDCTYRCTNTSNLLYTGDWTAGNSVAPASQNVLQMSLDLGISYAWGEVGKNYYATSGGAKPTAAPYSATANSPAATGTNDPFENAVPFVEGVSSSTFRLVSGADLTSTAPLSVTKSATPVTTNMTLSGSVSYSYSSGGVQLTFNNSEILIGGTNQVTVGATATVTPTTDAEAFLNAYLAAYPGVTRNTYVYVVFPSNYSASNSTWGYYLAIKQMADWLAANGDGNYSFYQATASRPFGYGANMPLWLAVRLYAEVIAPNWTTWITYTSAAGTKYTPAVSQTTGGSTVTVTSGNFVRTGTGDIEIASASNVILTNNLASSSAAAAEKIYTVGQRVTTPTATATDVLTGDAVTVDLTGLQTASGLYLTNGGDISISAGWDVIGRSGSILAETLLDSTGKVNILNLNSSVRPAWLSGESSDGANQYVVLSGLTTGVAALAGGDITIEAGRDVDDVPVLATSAIRTVTVTNADGTTAKGVQFLGDSDVTMAAGRDILGGLAYVTSGSITLDAVRDIRAAGGSLLIGTASNTKNYTVDRSTRLRLINATASATAGRDASIAWAGALPFSGSYGQWVTPVSSLKVIAGGDLAYDVWRTSDISYLDGVVVPGDITLAALSGNLTFGNSGSNGSENAFLFMEPVADGNLVLVAGGDIGAVTISMEDSDPVNLPGPFFTRYFYSWAGSSGTSLRALIFPTVTSETTEAWLRLYHSEDITHLGDSDPVFIAAGGDITDVALSLPKAARITAGGDIVNMMFFGQNLSATDVTRIAAGGDITATSTLLKNTVGGQEAVTRPTLQGNTFVIGGPGSFFLEAGGDIGPFLNSATVTIRTGNINDGYRYTTYDYGGGVLSVGYDWNPWLKTIVNEAGGGADLYVMFGLGAIGPDYTAFREKYVNPANVGSLTWEGYSTELLTWMKERHANLLLSTFGTTDVSETQAYAAFVGLPASEQHVFLLSEVYFNELEQVAVTSSASYLKYSRGYEAVNTLFPAANGYTANSLEGGAVDTDRVHTGDLDLRLATLQTTRGGDIRLLGPGGDIIAGSVVRTSTQAARRNYVTNTYGGMAGMSWGSTALTASAIDSIPTGLEGILTLRGGSISSFTDGSLVLNQSRLFTQDGGDIIAWSSNGDLNAGQGPKTSANFPPISVIFDWNLFGEVDEQAGVAGAGIAAFQPSVEEKAPDVYLLAPRGTVDAGDAGVRVAGNLSIAALNVINADNFQVSGSAAGVPVVQAPNVSGLSEASNAAGQTAQTAQPSQNQGAGASTIIIVEVLGFGGGDGTTPSRDDMETARRAHQSELQNPASRVQVLAAGELSEQERRDLIERKRREMERH